jgi:hypothetical protein
MKCLSFHLVAMSLLLGVSACGSPTSSLTAYPVPIPSGYNLLLSVEGDVQLQRVAWNGYHPTAFGAVLERGDLLRLGSNSKAEVLCDDLHIWEVPANSLSGISNGCPPPAEPVLQRSGQIGSTRGGNNPEVPYIISPRATALLSDSPVAFQWNPISNATTYTVRVFGGGLDWEITTTQTTLLYPDDAPTLQAGVTYAWSVTTDTGVSSVDEGVPGLGFQLLSAADAKTAQSHAQAVRALLLSPEAKVFAVAQLYASYNLQAEAIALLETQTQSTSAALYRALGDRYFSIGLAVQAQTTYDEALRLSENTDDLEGQALAHTRLGEVSVSLAANDVARQHLMAASDIYTQLGDKESAQDIQAKIQQLP